MAGVESDPGRAMQPSLKSEESRMSRFTGAAAPLSPKGIEASAHKLSVQPAELWAVLQVETRGCGFFADRRPAILFERHVFSRRTGGRFDKEAPDVSNPQAGGYAGGAAEYKRLEKAMALDAQAALMSASWGLGQVMGFHAEDLGYGTVEQFVTRMMESEDEQLDAVTTFLLRNHLDKPLREHDWAAFARGYNGAGYAKNQYDKKLATAYQAQSSKKMTDLTVREGQVRLMFLGFDPGGVDGQMGAHTKAALNGFQARHHLPTTSSFDAATMEALRQQQALLPRGDVSGEAAKPADDVPAPRVETAPVPAPVPAPVIVAPPPQPAPVVPAPAYPVATPLPAPAVTPANAIVPTLPVSAPLPLSLATPARSEAAVVAEPAPNAETPFPAELAERLRQRLAQPLGRPVQKELAHLLTLRSKASRELGAAAVRDIDLGIEALLAEQPNISFVQSIRSRISRRSISPAIEVVFGLGLLLLASNALFTVAHTALSGDGMILGLSVRMLLLVGLCGAMGSAVSILMRLSTFEKMRNTDSVSMVMMGFFKPVIGMYSALFCFALMKSGLLPLKAAEPDSELYLYIAVCFLVGFSERLATDLFTRAEESLGQAVGGAKAPAAPPPPRS